MIKKISDIVTLNKETYKKNELPSFLNYLDTGNLTKDKVDEYKRLILGKDKIPSRAQRKVRSNTILYSTVRPNQEHYGFVENPIENLIVSTGFTTIDVDDENIDSKFLYFKLTQKHITSYLHTIGMNSVSAYPSISPNDIGSLEFNFPNLSTQKQIAKVLSDLDAKIELNNKINQELEAMAKTLYDYWFVQFDFPDKNDKPYKSSGGEMVFNEELKRDIPFGWEVGTFETISTITGGSTPSKAVIENFTKENNISWITPKDLSQNKGKKFITRGEWDVSDLGIKNASLKIMPKGTVLLSSRAPIGYLAISRQEVTTNQGFKSFVSKENYSSEFIYYSVKNQIPKIEAYSSGSTFKEVSTSTLRTIKISIPNQNVLEQYYKISKPIFKKQNLLELENQKLSELRDWLLPMLMNGQVRVGNAEQEVEILGLVAEGSEKYGKG